MGGWLAGVAGGLAFISGVVFTGSRD